MDGLAAVRAAPNVASGNIARDVFEQINGGLVKVRDDLGWLIGLFSCILPNHQVRWNDEAHGFRADARAISDDEIAEVEQRFVFFPHWDVQERVGADDEKEAISVAVVDVTEIAHGVHGIVELRAAEILAGFGQRRNEVRMLGTSERDHGKPVRKRSEVLLQLVRGTTRGDEVELVEIKTPVSGTSNGKMAVVDGIEGTAKNRDAPRMMFCGGAVRLRCGQCASRESAAGPERIAAAYDISNSLTNLLLCSWRPPGGQQARTNDDALARPRRFRRDRAASPEWNQGPGEESCPGHRRWTGPDLSHRHPQQRKWR